MKKALYVAFSLAARPKGETLEIRGQLFSKDRMLSRTALKAFHETNGNLVFDLPYDIPDGQYTIRIEAFGDEGDLRARGSLTVERAALKRYFQTGNEMDRLFPGETIPSHGEQERVESKEADARRGYMLFRRSPLEYVFPESRPKESEIIEGLSIRTARNEFEPVTIALYPLRDLGTVTLSVTDLKGTRGTLSREKITIGVVEVIKEVAGVNAELQSIPSLIRAGNHVKVDNGRSQRFWLTIAVDKDVLPGVYRGRITISPQFGEATSLPLTVTVVPLSLEKMPGIDYFMLMTYEFTELTMPWSGDEKERIYRSALRVLRSYREHGMTILCIHSPFVPISNDDGSPNLGDIFAALRAARDSGFRKVIWYMGHLIQTSKPKHPGNIIGFKEGDQLPRLEYLVRTVSEYTKKNGCPDVIFLPIDEPDDSFQDSQGRRCAVTPLLLQTIKNAGGMTMLTTRDYHQFKPVDYLCSGELRREDLDAAHRNGSVYWAYNNDVTLKCENSAYARYIYGYYTWKNDIDGMSSWTFQNTQNARGLPGSDEATGDVYLAYPGLDVPLPTLKWEAIREGVDDHKLLRQLGNLIIQLRSKGTDTSKYEAFLADLKSRQGSPSCHLEDRQGGWDPVFFERGRERLMSMILDAEGKLSYSRDRVDGSNRNN
jgi:hypothetical protein